jgi:hypothetical protein
MDREHAKPRKFTKPARKITKEELVTFRVAFVNFVVLGASVGAYGRPFVLTEAQL